MATKSTPTDVEKFNIDIGKYVETLLRQWQLVAICAVGLGILALLFSLLINLVFPGYKATAVVASSKNVSAVNFGGAITSQSETDVAAAANAGAQYLYDRTARLQSYVSLVQNGTIAEQVLAQVGPKLDKKDQATAPLLRMVDANLIPNTDSIQISVSYKDPVIAAELANAWAQAYVRHINDLYGDTSTGTTVASIEAQTAKAKTDYETAHATLADFIAHDKSNEYKRQITELTVVVQSLRDARTTAISTIVSSQVSSTQQLIQELYSDQASNKLLALKTDQAARRELVLVYMEALSSGRVSVFTHQEEDLLTQLDRAYSDRRQADVFLANAISMRDAVKTGGDSAANSNALALTLLKTQIYAAFPGSNTLQVQNLPESLGSTIANVSTAGMVTDLDALISALGTRQSDLDKLIKSLSDELQNGSDYKFLVNSLDSSGALDKQIQDRYPELFSTSGLSGLSITAAEDNPLVQQAVKYSQDLLELKGLGDVMNFTVAGTPIETKIEATEQQIRDLEAQISLQASKQQELTAEDSLAWQSYSALSTKGTEVAVAAQTTGSEVVFASDAIPPDRKVIHSGIIAAAATALGFLLGVVGAYVYEFWQNYKGRPIQVLSQEIFAYARNYDYKRLFKTRKKSK